MHVFLQRVPLEPGQFEDVPSLAPLVAHDVIAMACVIVVLKLLFGFNGVKER